MIDGVRPVYDRPVNNGPVDVWPSMGLFIFVVRAQISERVRLGGKWTVVGFEGAERCVRGPNKRMCVIRGAWRVRGVEGVEGVEGDGDKDWTKDRQGTDKGQTSGISRTSKDHDGPG